MPADLIFRSRVVTIDKSRPYADFVAIKGERILAVGLINELETVTGPGTLILDCRDKVIVPGFNDAHCHVFSHIRKLLSLDVSPEKVRSIADIKAAVKAEASRTPPGAWISGTGYNEFYLADKRCPNRNDLDEAAPDHPVVLSQRSLHACVLNGRALELAGINRETPDPPGGLIDRDLVTGEPTGVLFEMLGFIREKIMPPVSAEDLARGAALFNRQFLSWGITSLQEATVTNMPERWRIYRELKENSVIKSRITMMAGSGTLPDFIAAGFQPGTGDNGLRLGAVKFLLDETSGEMFPPQPELNQRVLAAHHAGWQVAIHAIEPQTVAAALTSLEYAQGKFPRPDARHRIEHCSVCPPELLQRVVNLKAAVATQPPFIYYSGERYLATVPPEHLPWLYRISSMLAQGVVVAAGSDSPIVSANPLVGIFAAVSRRAQSGQTLLAGEAVSPARALAMYTINGACVSFEENSKGSLVPGKLADLVMLDADPLQTPLEELTQIKPVTTVIGGNVAWEA